MAKAINLGRKLKGLSDIANMLPQADEPHYPDLYISDIDDPRLLEMPDKGEAMIKFRVVGRNHSEDERGGKKERRCSLRLEILSIEPPEKKAKNNNGYGEEARKSFASYFKDK